SGIARLSSGTTNTGPSLSSASASGVSCGRGGRAKAGAPAKIKIVTRSARRTMRWSVTRWHAPGNRGSFQMKAWVFLGAILSATTARASECGEARVAYEHFKAGAKIDQDLKHAKLAHDSREQLDKWEKKFKAACVPRKAS